MSVAPSWKSDGWCVHEDPTRAVTAIAAMGRFGAAFAAPPAAAPPKVAPAVNCPTATLSEAEAKRLLASAGIQSAPEQACDSADAAVAAAELFGFPVVMKILSPRHRAQVGDRRRAAECRRCRCGARWLRPADRAREACGTRLRASRACWWRSSCRAASSASWASTAIRCSARSPCSVWAASSSR